MTGVDVLDGSPASPPRDNGEIVFEAPWQSRAFGVVISLVEDAFFSWEEFRTQLIVVIEEWDAQDDGDRPTWHYYECWLEALERVLQTRSHFKGRELDDLAAAYLDRPHTMITDGRILVLKTGGLIS